MALPKRIMVVDDEERLRDLLFDVLTDSGFKVTLASDGQESLDRMQDRRFDLVITDINMPRLDGIGLLKRMKKEGRKEKVIIMTARPVDHLRLGEEIPVVSRQLNKPFRVSAFMEAVSSALEPHRKNRKRRDIGKETENRKERWELPGLHAL